MLLAFIFMLQICSLSSSSSAIIKLSQEALQERVHINAGIFFTSAAALFSFITIDWWDNETGPWHGEMLSIAWVTMPSENCNLD